MDDQHQHHPDHGQHGEHAHHHHADAGPRLLCALVLTLGFALVEAVAALVSGAVVMATGWTTADPLLSLLIYALMLAASRHALAAQGITHVTLQAEPLTSTVRWQAGSGRMCQQGA